LKDNIEPIPNAKEKFMKLKPCQYHYKSDDEQQRRFGFIAQELQELYPDFVYQSEITEKDDDGIEFKPLLLTQTNLIPIMVDQIQQLHKVVDSQATIIAAHEATIARMQADILSLHASLSQVIQHLNNKNSIV
jgi:hypothetical protein